MKGVQRRMCGVVAICCLVVACIGKAPQQIEVPDAEVSYLDQTHPEKEAVVFAPGIVSVEGRYEYGVSFHPDGNQVLFTGEVPDQGAALFRSRLIDGVWSEPEQVSLTDGSRSSEMEAFFSPDGESLFFAPYDEGMDVRIWRADVTPDGFANPRPLGSPVDQDPAFFPVQATDGTLYYTNLAKRTIYQASFEGGHVISAESAGLEAGGHAFPAPDGSYILVDSASLNSEGKRDIFVAFRSEDGSWGSLQPLGPEVNTEFGETCPSLSPDGKFLFFSRYNEPEFVSNIYWVSSDVIEPLPNS